MSLVTFVKRRLNQQAPRLGDILSDLHGTKLTGTTHATPGTGVNVAHGLTHALTGVAIAPYAAFIIQGNGYVDSSDATNVVIKSAAASQALVILVVPDPGDTYKTLRKA